MKINLKLALFFFFLMIGLFPLQVYSEDSTLSEIEEELKWIQEEAKVLLIKVATKTEMKTKDAPSIVSVISGEQIRNMGARDIIDVLRTVPGFDLTFGGGYPRHKTNIRGLISNWNEKVRIMINGHSLRAFWGGPDQHFDKLPLDNIKKIEIIRGPGSAIYGTGAFLGVVNIITKEGGDKPSQVSFEGGSHKTMRPSAELSFSGNDLKTYLFAEEYQTDGYEGIVESDRATISPPASGLAPSESREMTSKTTHSTFQTNISYKDIYFNGFFQKASSETPIATTGVLTDESDVDSYYLYAELGYKHPLSDKGNLQLKTWYDYAVYDFLSEQFPEETAALNVGFPEGTGLEGIIRGKNHVSGAEITADYELYNGIGLMIGTSYEYIKQRDIKTYGNYNATGDFLEVDGVIYPPFPSIYFPGGMTDISENANWIKEAERVVTAAYTQCIINLEKLFSLEKGVETLALTVGGRYDNYDDVGSTVNPRFGIVYSPIKNLWFKALYGTAFRAPNFQELYIQKINYSGNADLEPEEITMLEPEEITTSEILVGYDFTRNISASITGFHISAKNLIYSLDRITQNVGKMESYGTETEIRASFDKNKYAYLNFTWQNVKDVSNITIVSTSGQQYTQDDFQPGGVADFLGNIGLNYGFTERIIGNIALNYVSKRERTEEKTWRGENLVYRDQRSAVSERWLLNASVRFKDFFTKGLEFQLSGYNLLDDDHRDPAKISIENDIPRPGVTFMGRVSYSF